MAIVKSRSTRTGSDHRRAHSLAEGLAFVSPFLIGFIAWRVYPLLYSIWLTLHSWDLLTPAKYVGLQNFEKLANDTLMLKSLGNTSYLTFIGVPLHLLLALGLAIALNVEIRGRAIYRTIFYLPSITPAVASAVIWRQIFQPEFGVLNTFLGRLGISPIKWLWEPAVVKPAFIFMGSWGIGPQMIIFLAGLQGIPKQLYEAAEIDGATRWKRIIHVTLPLLSPVLFFNLVMGIIGSFQIFTSAFVMTGGGPQNATLFTVLYIYRNAFEYFKMGYAALLAWVLCIIIILFTFLQFRVGERWVYYES